MVTKLFLSSWVHNYTVFPRCLRVGGSHVTYSYQWKVSRRDVPWQAEAVKCWCAFSISLCIGLCRLVSGYEGFLKATYWRWLCLSTEKNWLPEWLCGAELIDHIELWQNQAINFHCTKSLRFLGSSVTAITINWYSCTAQGHGSLQ